MGDNDTVNGSADVSLFDDQGLNSNNDGCPSHNRGRY